MSVIINKGLHGFVISASEFHDLFALLFDTFIIFESSRFSHCCWDTSLIAASRVQDLGLFTFFADDLETFLRIVAVVLFFNLHLGCLIVRLLEHTSIGL